MAVGSDARAKAQSPEMETGELISKMKLSKLALVAAIACGTYAGNVFADQPNEIRLVSCDCGEPVCGCEAAVRHRGLLR